MCRNLTSFYGRFFVEEGQFIKDTSSTSSLHLGTLFIHLLTLPRFGAESSGSQPGYRKLFPHGLHNSKNNFLGIKISQRRDWECPSLSYYGSWYPPMICSPLLAKQYSRASGDWLSRIEKHVVVSAYSVTSGRGCGGKVICHKKVQQSFLNQNLDLPSHPPNEKFLDLPLQRCYSEFGANQGLCWRVQVNQFFRVILLLEAHL